MQSTVENIEEATKWIDNFVVDEQKIDLKTTMSREFRSGFGLMSNPFDNAKSKLKKKQK